MVWHSSLWEMGSMLPLRSGIYALTPWIWVGSMTALTSGILQKWCGATLGTQTLKEWQSPLPVSWNACSWRLGQQYESKYPTREATCIGTEVQLSPGLQAFPPRYQACEWSNPGPCRLDQLPAIYPWVILGYVTWNKRIIRLNSAQIPDPKIMKCKQNVVFLTH